MPRSWEGNRVEGGLSGLDDDDFGRNGTVGLGSGTVGGEYNVTDDGHTVSDEQVANSDRLVRTGNDSVMVTGTDQGNQQVGDTVGGFAGGNTTLLLAGAVGLAAVYVGVRQQ